MTMKKKMKKKPNRKLKNSYKLHRCKKYVYRMRKRAASTPEPKRQQPDPVDIYPETVSILDFDHDCQSVKFTEKATLEAIRRLGINVRDIDFRPMHTFRRPGCDESVTALLFKKYEAKRQNLINEVTEMRKKVLEEAEKRVATESPTIRVGRARVEREKKALEDVRRQRDADLKKLVIFKYREMFQRQIHQSAVNATMTRTAQIDKMKEEMLRTARERSEREIAPSPQSVPRSEPPQALIDAHRERVRRMREEEAIKRKEKAKAYAEKLQQRYDRSTQIHEEQQEQARKKIMDEEERFNRWKQSRNEFDMRRNEKFRNRVAFEEGVVSNGAKREEERKQALIGRISEYDARSRMQTDKANSAKKERLDAMKKRLTERVKKANETLERQTKERDNYRIRLDQQDEEVAERHKQQVLSQTLKLMDRQLDREERVDKVKRKAVAKQYAIDMQMRKSRDDSRVASALDQERSRLAARKSLENSRFLEKREQIVSEIGSIDCPDDPKAMRKVMGILKIDEAEMKTLIDVARNTVGEYSRPSTALCSRARTPRLRE